MKFSRTWFLIQGTRCLISDLTDEKLSVLIAYFEKLGIRSVDKLDRFASRRPPQDAEGRIEWEKTFTQLLRNVEDLPSSLLEDLLLCREMWAESKKRRKENSAAERDKPIDDAELESLGKKAHSQKR